MAESEYTDEYLRTYLDTPGMTIPCNDPVALSTQLNRLRQERNTMEQNKTVWGLLYNPSNRPTQVNRHFVQHKVHNDSAHLCMTPAQELHLEQIKANFCSTVDLKYRTGQAEHGGNLWDKKGLIDMALDEAIDQVTYLLALKQQIAESGVELGTVQE